MTQKQEHKESFASFGNVPNIVPVTFPEQLTTELFHLIDEGDSSKIKEFLTIHKIPLNVSNENGDSLIHIVLNKDPKILSENSKLQMIKFLTENGAPIDMSNKFNITPLHLASMFQYSKIITFLVNLHANLQSVDVNKQAPLHYAVIGNTYQCKSIKRIKNFIKKNESKIDDSLDILSDSIIDVLSLPPCRQYIKHIRRTIDNIRDISQFTYDKLENEYTDDIIKIMSRTDIDYPSKLKIITEKVESYHHKILNDLKDKLRVPLSNLDIYVNRPTGWEHILPYNDKFEILDALSIMVIREKYMSNFKEIETSFNQLRGNLISSIVRPFSDFNESIDIITRLVALKNNPQYNEQLKQLLLHPITDTTIPSCEIDIKDTDDVIEFKTIGPKQLHIYEVNEEKRRKGKELFFDLAMINPFTNKDGRSIYITSRIHRYFENTLKHLNIINYNMYNLLDHTQNEIYYHLYHKIITSMVVSIINICQNLTAIKYEIDQFIVPVVHKIFGFIKSTQDFTLDTPPGFKHNIDTYFQKFSDLTGKISDSITESYKNIRVLMNFLNTQITYINFQSALEYIILFHRERFDGNKIERLSNLFTRQFEPLNMISSSFNEYFNHYIPSVDPQEDDEKRIEYKTKIIKEYVPQLHKKHYMFYLIDETKWPDDKKLRPLMDTDRKKYGTDNSLIPARVPKGGNTNLGFLHENLINKPTNINDLRYGDETVTGFLEDDKTYVGKIGLRRLVDYAKESIALQSIDTLLDHHFNILKFELVKHIIEVCKNIVTNAPKNHPEEIMREAILIFCQKYQIDLKKLSKNSIEQKKLYVLVGKLTDNILINFIQMCISRTSKRVIDSFYQDIEKSKEYKIIISNDVSSFKVNLHEINESIIKEFGEYYHKEMKDNLTFIDKLVEDPKQEEGHLLMEENYQSSNPHISKTCLNTKSETIDTLISLGASIHSTDNSGMTPLYYAIKNKQLEIINILLKQNSSVVRVKDISNETPLQYLIHLFKNHHQVLFNHETISQSLQTFTQPFYQKLYDSIEQREQFGNNIIKGLSLIFDRCIFYLNHQFSFMMNHAMGRWDSSNHTKFFDTLHELTNKDINMTNYSIFMDVPTIGESREVILARILDLQDKLKDLEIKTLEHEAKKKILEDKKSKITFPPSLDNTRLFTILENTLKIIEDNLKKIDDSKQSITNEILLQQQIINTYLKYGDSILKKKVEDFNELKGNHIIEVYDKFMNHLKIYYKMYDAIWRKYMINIDAHLTQSEPHLLLLLGYPSIIKNLEDLKDKESYDKCIENLKTMQLFYQKITNPFIHDYETLPNDYIEDNYVLSFIVDMITHNVRVSICYQMYKIIVRAIIEYVVASNSKKVGDISTFTGDEYQKHIMILVDDIIEEISLSKDVLEEYPKTLVKYVLKIYDNQHDVTKEYKNISEILENIPNKLMMNTVIGINSDSTLIRNIKETIIPYFEIIFTETVSSMKIISDNYLRYIVNESKYINILIELLEYAKNELFK